MAVLPISERGYSNPGLLIDTEELETILRNPDLRLIDVRSAELYASGHIPGAVNLAAFGGIPRATNGDMGTAEEFTRLAASLGVNTDSRVVVYDAPGAQMGMAAWAFLYYGHDQVQVLDGGYAKWTEEGRPVSTEPGAYPAGNFQATVQEGLFCSLEHAKRIHGTPGTVFWDVRRQSEYEGTEALNNPRAGHVAGAVHLEWTELLDPETGTFKPGPELRALLTSRGITPEAEIASY